MKRGLIVIVVLIVSLAIKYYIRLKQRAHKAPSVKVRRPKRDWKPFGNMGLVAGREMRERLHSRLFRGVTVVLFLAVGAAVVIPTLHINKTKTSKVGVVAGSVQLNAELQKLANYNGIKVQLINEPGVQQARDSLSSGDLDLAIDGTKSIIVDNPISASDTSAQARYVRDLSQILGEQGAYTQAKLSGTQASIVAGAKPLQVQSIKPAKSHTTSETTALLGVILIFIILNQYLAWTLMGVMEEKANRVVEVLLSTVRPIQLLGGKVAGIGIVALTQALALLIFALVLGAAVGSSLVHGAAAFVVISIFVWLVLGYAFYSWVYAAAGSLAERQDQVQSLALPLAIPLVFGYIVSLVGASSGNPSLLVKVLAYIPPTAPFAMTTLVGFGEATWWQFLVSVLICIASILVVASIAAKIYRAAILQTGRRVKLRHLTKS